MWGEGRKSKKVRNSERASKSRKGKRNEYATNVERMVYDAEFENATSILSFNFLPDVGG